MSLSDIYVQLNQLGFQVEFLGDVNSKYSSLKVDVVSVSQSQDGEYVALTILYKEQ